MGLAAAGADAVAASMALSAELIGTGGAGATLALPLERNGRHIALRTGGAPDPAERSGTLVFSPRLLCVLLSALSKIAARSPDQGTPASSNPRIP